MPKSIKPVLIIEDNFVLAHEWAEALTNTGRYRPIRVSTASQAEDSIDFTSVDLYIIDLYFIRGGKVYQDGGLRAIGPIKRENPYAKIIVVTAHYTDFNSDFTTKDLATNLGADYFLRKPFEVAELIDTLDEADLK